MSKSIKVHVVFGFKAKVELFEEDFKAFDSIGLLASPVCYTTDEDTNQYIIGREVATLDGAQQYSTVNFDSAQSDQMTQEIIHALNAIAFEVIPTECKLLVNTYYF